MQDKQSAATSEAIALCRGLLDNSVPLIAGCRRPRELRHKIGFSEDDVFDPFIAVDCETDHLPLGEVRRHCSPEWLEKADAEIADSERIYRDLIHGAAEALLLVLSAQAGESK